MDSLRPKAPFSQTKNMPAISFNKVRDTSLPESSTDYSPLPEGRDTYFIEPSVVRAPARVRLVAAFAFAAGFVDSNTKLRFNTFGSLMTGNMLEVGLSLTSFRLADAAYSALNIFAFQVGVVANLLCTLSHEGSQGGKPWQSPAQDQEVQPSAPRTWSALLICGLLVACDLCSAAQCWFGDNDPTFDWCGQALTPAHGQAEPADEPEDAPPHAAELPSAAPPAGRTL